MPGNTNASLPPPASSPLPVKKMSWRPRHDVPRSTTRRALSIRSGVGSNSASRHGPAPLTWRSRASTIAAGDSAASSSTRSRSAAGAARRARAPAPCCSSTTWALMPPKPNALTPARRGAAPDSHGRTVRIGSNLVSASSGCGSSQCSVGGSSPWWTASAALIRPATPAAGIVWPIIDFTEPIPTGGPSPNTCASVRSSASSPVGVPVPCASISPTVAGSRPAASHARASASAWPATRGFIRLDSLPSLATPVPRMTA